MSPYGPNLTGIIRLTQVWIFPTENTRKLNPVVWALKPILVLESQFLECPGHLQTRVLACKVCWSFAQEENDHNAKNHNWPSAFPDVEPSVSINFPRCVSSLGLASCVARNTHGEGAEVVIDLSWERALCECHPAYIFCESQLWRDKTKPWCWLLWKIITTPSTRMRNTKKLRRDTQERGIHPSLMKPNLCFKTFCFFDWLSSLVRYSTHFRVYTWSYNPYNHNLNCW